MPYVVPVQHGCQSASSGQLVLDRAGDGALARPAEAREPEHATPLSEHLLLRFSAKVAAAQ